MIAAAALTGSLAGVAGLVAGAFAAHRWFWPWYLRRYYLRKGVPPAEM
jgi:hypothetical protein